MFIVLSVEVMSIHFVWSSGMIPALSAGSPGFKPHHKSVVSDSEVVITVDFESTIRSSNLRRRMNELFIVQQHHCLS